MTEGLERREFFKKIFQKASQTIQTLAGGLDDGVDNGHDPGEMAPSILSDLPPELLAMEAQRLGLDPRTDRDRVLEALEAAMHGPGT
ncbi:MAG: hypothetical protein JEZ12_25915 [Desulfobacterium sp.]|nr:hypothetical protein [Desulfobacterium sp.]